MRFILETQITVYCWFLDSNSRPSKCRRRADIWYKMTFKLHCQESSNSDEQTLNRWCWILRTGMGRKREQKRRRFNKINQSWRRNFVNVENTIRFKGRETMRGQVRSRRVWSVAWWSYSQLNGDGDVEGLVGKKYCWEPSNRIITTQWQGKRGSNWVVLIKPWFFYLFLFFLISHVFTPCLPRSRWGGPH